MEIPIHITFKNLDPAPAVASAIRAHVTKLERFFPHIVGCHVTVESPHRHQRHGRVYKVMINLHIPGHDINVGHHRQQNHSHEDIMVAVNDAFHAARRRLEDSARTMRGAVKHHSLPS